MKNKQVIAVCGKGGVGKTVYTSLLAKVISDRGEGNLLAVDADPALGLHYSLGRKGTKTIGSVRDEIIRTAESGNKEEVARLADKIEYLVAQSLDEGKDFSFIAMGSMEKTGCFCSVNGLLKRALEEVTGSYDTVLIDGEAGIEQINRQVIESVDTLVVVTDTSLRGMKTVEYIANLLEKGIIPKCRKFGIVFNHPQTEISSFMKRAEELSIPVFGTIPYDKTVEEFDHEGRSLLELPAGNPALQEAQKSYEAFTA